MSTVADLRTAVHAAAPDALVGGSAAQRLDTQQTSARDLRVIVPSVLVVILLVLIGLLRAVLAPVLIVVANLLSFGATLGIGALVFNHVFGFPGVGRLGAAVRVRVPGGARDRLLDLPDDPGARGVAAARHPPRGAARAGGDRRGDHQCRAWCWPRRSGARGDPAAVPRPDRVPRGASACCSTRSWCARCWSRASCTTWVGACGGPGSGGSPTDRVRRRGGPAAHAARAASRTDHCWAVRDVGRTSAVSLLRRVGRRGQGPRRRRGGGREGRREEGGGGTGRGAPAGRAWTPGRPRPRAPRRRAAMGGLPGARRPCRRRPPAPPRAAGMAGCSMSFPNISRSRSGHPA